MTARGQRHIRRDLDQAEMERCDVFDDDPDFTRRALDVPPDRWAAMLARWREENPEEAQVVDQALGDLRAEIPY